MPVLPGYWFFYAQGTVEGGSTLAPPLYAAASRANASVLDRVLNALVVRVQTLSFPFLTTPPGIALPAGNIRRFDAFGELVLPLIPRPGIAVSVGTSVSFTGGTAGKDDLGLPALVVLVDNGAPQNLIPFPTWQLWEERLSRGLRNQRLPGLAEIYTVRPDSYTPHSWSGPGGTTGYDIAYCAMPFRVMSREPRGI